ncbi:MAG: Na+/H+ antiporter NhaA [Bacteroidales bacterium]
MGELNSPKKHPAHIAAAGGMLIPLLLFLLLNNNPETEHGWEFLSHRHCLYTGHTEGARQEGSLSLKIFPTAFAIIDDLGAVIIAIFYTGQIEWNLILYALGMLSILYLLSFKKIHNRYLIFIFGIVIWLLFLKGGIHPTIAGILLAFAVPIRQKINEFTFSEQLSVIMNNIVSNENTNRLPVLSESQIEQIDELEEWTGRVQSPLQQLEHRLHDWVAYLIMPLFAFANAGVTFSGSVETDLSLASSVGIALLAGKMLGVTIFSYAGLRLKLASLPEGVNFTQITGVAFLAGVGFTMSLFIGNLAFIDNPGYLDSSKIGIIAGSLISGIIGYAVLKYSFSKK